MINLASLDDLPAQLQLASLEQVYATLLTNKTIMSQLPDLSQWKCTTAAEAFAEANRIDAKGLIAAINQYCVASKPPFQLTNTSVMKLAQHLVYICHIQSVFTQFNQESFSQSEWIAVLDAYVNSQKVLPIIKGMDQFSLLGVDELLPFNLVALQNLNPRTMQQILITLKMITTAEEALSKENCMVNDERAYHLATLALLIKALNKPLASSSSDDRNGVLVDHLKSALQVWFSQDQDASDELAMMQTVGTAIAPANQLSVAGPDWARQIVSTLESLQYYRKATNLTCFAYELPPERIQEYVDLQSKIAKLIPLEYERPTIILRLRGKDRVLSEQLDLGMLGGMGPLSDAHMVNQLLKMPNQNKTNILLVSSPPARDDEKAKDPTAHQAHKNFRMQQLHYLRRANSKKYAMLSNTSHLHRQGFKFITGDVISILLGSGVGRFIHSVKEIAQRINQMGSSQRILILGTTEAALGDLYLSLLKPSNAVYPFGDATPTEAELPAEQIALQAFIDAAKTSPQVDKKIALDFCVALDEWIQKTKPTHVLLACTEIPLLMNTLVTANETVMQMLKRMSKGLLPTFVDTEYEMIQILSREKQLQEQQSHIEALKNRMRVLTTEIKKDKTALTANDVARGNVLSALEVALDLADRAVAIQTIKEAVKHNPGYSMVKTLFLGEQSSTGIIGRTTRLIGTTRGQSGDVMPQLVDDVISFLKEFLASAQQAAQNEKSLI